MQRQPLKKHNLVNPGYAFGLLFHHFHIDQSNAQVGSLLGENLGVMLNDFGLDRILRAEEWKHKAITNSLSPKDVCLTFDDGLASQYEIALPILEQFNLTAFWFIYTSPIEGEADSLEMYRYFKKEKFKNSNDFYDAFFRVVQNSGYNQQIKKELETADIKNYLPHAPFYSEYDKVFRYTRDQILKPEKFHNLMNLMMLEHQFDPSQVSDKLYLKSEQIFELAQKGHSIGLHSHTHPTDLKNLPVNLQKEEFIKNKEILELITQSTVDIASHPCNSYSSDTLNILESLGIRIGFRADLNQAEHSSLEYPRLNHSLIYKN